MRFAWFLLVALAAYAQQPAYEIRGVLLDKITNQPVQGRVLVIKIVERKTNSVGLVAGVEMETAGEPTTNASGEFRFESKEPGEFEVIVGVGRDHLEERDTVTLTPADPKQEIRFLLDRKGEVTGRVVDDETGKPLPGIAVTVLQTKDLNGGDAVSTTADGTFRKRGAFLRTPWTAAILPRLWADDPDANPRREITAEEAQSTDEDYEPSYWPGGARSLAGVLPAPYVPGQTTDLGTIRARKITYRRALVHVPPENCGSSQLYFAELSRAESNQPDYGVKIFCGQDVLLKGLMPGEQYRLKIRPQRQAPEDVRTANVSFVVGDRNPELTAILKLGADLEGRVKFVEGSGAKPEGISLSLENDFQLLETKADAEGRFRFVNVPVGEVMLLLGGKIAQAARFNGRDVGVVIPSFEWSGQGSIELTFDDRPAVIQGEVSDSSKPIARAVVVAVRWPLPAGPHAIVFSTVSGEADPKGRYQLPPLPAGEYRVLALPAAARDAFPSPEALSVLLSRAEKVTLTRGGSASLNLRVIDPTR